jgi:hypothetical protein
MAVSLEAKRRQAAERARRSRERRKWAGSWRNTCQECGEPEPWCVSMYKDRPFDRGHSKHATFDNTMVFVDGDYLEPRVRAGRVLVPRPPVRGSS